MKHQIYMLLAIFMLSNISAFSQKYANNGIKAVYIVKFIKHLQWSNEADFSKYEIAIFNDDTTIIKELEYLTTNKIRNKKIKIKKVKKISNAYNSQILYVNAEKADQIKDILKKIKGRNILLISDMCTEQKAVMINFIYKKHNQAVTFEINTKNIEEQNLTILPKLLVLGGTEIDVRKLYIKSQDSLKEERMRIEGYKLKIEKQKIDILRQSKEINNQKTLLANQKNEIRLQQKKIDKQKKNLDGLSTEVKKQQKTLWLNLKKILDDEQQIKEQENKMNLQLTNINKYSKILEAQLKEIEKQNETLNQQSSIIKTQKNTIYFFIIVVILVAIMLIMIYRSYRNKQKANQLLHIKNSEIIQQKEEISAQAEQIEKVNDTLTFQNANIKSSIRYAKTIQQAILPSQICLSKMFDNFVLYRPKDIVSGDFYWFYKLEDTENDIDKAIIAVIDCTGHGVPGAFMTMISNTLLNSIIMEKRIIDPSKILTILNENIKKSLHQDQTNNDDGMDVSLCYLEKNADYSDQWEVSFCGAKRYLLQYSTNNNKLSIIDGTRRSIGGKNRRKKPPEFENKKITLIKNDCLYLLSDGLTDQNNNKRKNFGIDRLTDILQNNCKKDMEQQKYAIEKELDKHMKNEEQRDDITMIGIKI